MILWFDEISKNDIAKAGGKGANLGEMANAGFPVPPGFCITTEVYSEHIQNLELQHLIDKMNMNTQIGSMQGLDDLSTDIRSRIEESQISARAEHAIKTAYRKLLYNGTPLVSVRSSATAEDLPDFSFAGQQETFLSVQGEDQLLNYVKKCWASLWTPRSISYRQKNGFAHEQVLLSVVVQTMVQSEKSGVLFTVNPLSGNLEEMMVNASYGLGESVVSGRVTPDTYRILKHGEPLILEKNLGSKETRIDTGLNGLVEEAVISDELRNLFCLDEPELRILLDLGIRVENHYGKPQDIEWAIAGGKLFLLQTRPVTKLSEDPAMSKSMRTNRISRIQQKLLDNFKEHIPDAPYPLEYETLLLLNRHKNAVFHELGITMPKENKIVKMDEHGVLSIGRLFPHPNIRIFGIPVIMQQMKRLSQTDETRNTKAKLQKEFDGLGNIDLLHLNNQALFMIIMQSIDIAMQYIYMRFRVYVFPMMFFGFSINRLIKKENLTQALNQYDFLAGLNYKTAEIEHALYNLAKEIDESSAVRQLYLEVQPGELLPILKDKYPSYFTMFTGFLNTYGARTVKAYMPFSTLSWSECPELLIETCTTILKAGCIKEHIEQQEKGKEKYSDLKEKVSRNFSPAKRQRFERLLEQFRSAYLGREDLIYLMEQCFVIARRGVTEAAERLCRQGLLNKIEDIHYLKLSELKRVLLGEGDMMSLKKVIADRKAHRSMTEQIWSSPPSQVFTEGDVIQGLSGSPGLARGVVRIINNPAEFGRLQKAEILVCRFTDPVWTPLFPVACAVVCDTGGPLSHAAIVAREYGIPAVLGTKNSTSILKDGQIVTVDGSKGLVMLR